MNTNTNALKLKMYSLTCPTPHSVASCTFVVMPVEQSMNPTRYERLLPSEKPPHVTLRTAGSEVK